MDRSPGTGQALKALCTEIFEHVFSDELTQEKTHDFSTEKKDIKAEITHILYHIKFLAVPSLR